MQPFYIYDPNVGDELGGMRVRQDKDGNKHVLATVPQIQYWLDQGLLGDKPLGQISGPQKELLNQITRGRLENNEDRRKRVPKYNRKVMGGEPSFATLSSSPMHASRKRQKERQKERNKNGKQPPRKPEPKSPPPAAA